MGKWPVQSTLNRARPTVCSRSTFVFEPALVSRLHTSVPTPEQSTATRAPSRAQEQRNKAANAIQDLYQQTRTRSQSSPNPSGSRNSNSENSISSPHFRRLSGFGPSQGAASGPLDLRSLSAQPGQGAPAIRRQTVVRRPNDTQRSGTPQRGGSFQGRSNIQRGNRSSGGSGSGSRAPGARSQRPGGGQRRRRFAEGGSGKEFTHSNTSAEKAYLAEHKEKSSRPKIYNPTNMTVESLTNQGPLIPVGDLGSMATMQDRMQSLSIDNLAVGTRVQDLTTRLLSGGFVHFRSEAEKNEVLAQAHEIVARRALDKPESEKQGLAFETLSQEEREQFVQDLFSGKYRGPAGQGAKGLMGEISRLAWRNETYLEKDEVALTRKLGSLIAVPRAMGRGGKRVVKEARV